MSLNLKKILGALILVIGLIFFFLSIANNNLNLALVSLTSTLIFWTIYSLFLDEFDIQIRGRKVPVVYATQERYAQMQSSKGC